MASEIDNIEMAVVNNMSPYCPPTGLVHIIAHYGTAKKEVFRRLFGVLAYGNGYNGNTLVFPQWLREVVRMRFKNEETKNYDEQFQQEAIKITNEDLANASWPEDKRCKLCQRFN